MLRASARLSATVPRTRLRVGSGSGLRLRLGCSCGASTVVELAGCSPNVAGCSFGCGVAFCAGCSFGSCLAFCVAAFAAAHRASRFFNLCRATAHTARMVVFVPYSKGPKTFVHRFFPFLGFSSLRLTGLLTGCGGGGGGANGLSSHDGGGTSRGGALGRGMNSRGVITRGAGCSGTLNAGITLPVTGHSGRLGGKTMPCALQISGRGAGADGDGAPAPTTPAPSVSECDGGAAITFGTMGFDQGFI